MNSISNGCRVSSTTPQLLGSGEELCFRSLTNTSLSVGLEIFASSLSLCHSLSCFCNLSNTRLHFASRTPQHVTSVEFRVARSVCVYVCSLVRTSFVDFIWKRLHSLNSLLQLCDHSKLHLWQLRPASVASPLYAYLALRMSADKTACYICISLLQSLLVFKAFPLTLVVPKVEAACSEIKLPLLIILIFEFSHKLFLLRKYTQMTWYRETKLAHKLKQARDDGDEFVVLRHLLYLLPKK